MDDAKTFKTDAIREENPAIQDRTIVAAFADATTADAARQALKTKGYKDVDITTADPADAGKPVHEHGFWNRIKTLFGGHRDAPVYGEALRRGHSLLTLHTEQGRAAYAIDVLDGFAPIDIKGGEQAWIDESQRQAAATDVVPTPDTLIAGSDGSVIEEDLLIIETDPNQGNDRVRSYTRNLPIVVTDADGEAIANIQPDAVKRAD